MNFVHTNSLKNMLCLNCDKYLSVFPVYSERDGSSTCGRCPIPGDSFRNFLYESVVEHQKFPCCYDSSGCIENLFPKDVKKHEKICSFKQYSCPILSNCNWNGSSKDLLDHVDGAHPVFVIKGPFEIDFINNHKEKYLLPEAEEIFLVDRSTDSNANILYFNVSYLGSNPCYENYSYTLILENNNRKQKHEIKKKLEERIEICGNEIRNILNDPVSILGRIDIVYEQPIPVVSEENEKNSLDLLLLKELECLVCYEYMTPPIYQCLTGHSLCETCKKGVTQCPYCESGFQNTINFALGQIVNFVNYPCKYDRCNFIAKAKDIKIHQENCIWGPFKCPLNSYFGCEKDLVFNEVYDHVLNNHKENLLEMEVVTLPFNKETTIEDCFIIKYGNKLFILHFAYDKSELSWAVQKIGSEDDKNYKFEVDILDNSGQNRRIYFKKLCGIMTDHATAFENIETCVFIDYEDIATMIFNNVLNFRIRAMQE